MTFLQVGCGNARQSLGYICCRAFRWTLFRSYDWRVHFGFWSVLALAVLGFNAVRRSLLHLGCLYTTRDLRVSIPLSWLHGLMISLCSPIILVKKAKALRQKTGNEDYYAPLEKADKKPFATRANEILAKPFKMTIQEPMLLAINIYMSVSEV